MKDALKEAQWDGNTRVERGLVTRCLAEDEDECTKLRVHESINYNSHR